MLDYDERLRIWKSEAEIEEQVTHSGLINSLYYHATLSTYNASSLVSGLYELASKGIKRPLWTQNFQLTVHMLKNYLHFENHSLINARAGMEVLHSIIPYPKNVDLELIQVQVNMQELMQFEKEGNSYRSVSGAPNYPIPEEVNSNDYSIKGEFMYLKESSSEKSVILYLHGGAYILGSPAAFRHLASKLALETGCDVLVIDYRLAPEHPFPAALHDALAAYLWLLNPDHQMFSSSSGKRHCYKPQNIYLGGDSAGGGLVMCFLNYLNKYLRYTDGRSIVPLPGAAFMFSPWIDLTMSSNSLRINSEYDYLPKKMTDLHNYIYPGIQHPVYSYILGEDSKRRLPILDSNNRNDISLYRPEHGPKTAVENYMYHPLISPVFETNFSCLPPILIQSGDCEMLRDETITLAYKISVSNRGNDGTQSKVRHELYKDMVHVFQAITSMKSSQIAIENVSAFLDHAKIKGHLDDLSKTENDYVVINSHHEE